MSVDVAARWQFAGKMRRASLERADGVDGLTGDRRCGRDGPFHKFRFDVALQTQFGCQRAPKDHDSEHAQTAG